MPARADELEWVRINDFSPGIRQRTEYIGGDVAPSGFTLGAATIDTFRCIAIPGGGLGPLPKKTVAYVPSSYPATPSAVSNDRITVVGFLAAGAVFDAVGGTDLMEFHIGYEYKQDSDSTRQFRWQRHRMWEATPTIDTLVTDSSAESNPSWPSARPLMLHMTRANKSTPTSPGSPVVVGAWYAGGGANTKVWSMFPDPDSFSAVGVENINSTRAYELAFGHQGRSVALRQQGLPHSGAAILWSDNEEIWYTDTNTPAISLTVGQVFGEENPTGVSVCGSLNASEALFIKNVGGGYLIRGDIGDPTVIALPGLPRIGNFRQVGVSTPIGFIFGSRDGGIWAWAGGETADYLSPQLEPSFWYNLPQTDNDFTDFVGKFAYWDEWILTPKNWIYDFQSHSWWRLEDPTVVNIQQWSLSVVENRVYGAVQHITAAGDAVVHGWAKNDPADTFKWTSQPIPLAWYRESEVRQLSLIGQGVGTIKVTVKSALTGESQNETFTFASDDYPVAHRENLRLDGTHFQIILESTATATAGAPIVYEVALGYRPARMIPVPAT